MSNRGAKALCVIVVADNPETIDGLHQYLSQAGVASRSSRALPTASMLKPKADALVLFPDEFEDDDVVAKLTELRAAHPRLPILLVTGYAQRFGRALKPDGRSLPPIVLPKPAFGWTIVDAVRAQASDEEA